MKGVEGPGGGEEGRDDHKRRLWGSALVPVRKHIIDPKYYIFQIVNL